MLMTVILRTVWKGGKTGCFWRGIFTSSVSSSQAEQLSWWKLASWVTHFGAFQRLKIITDDVIRFISFWAEDLLLLAARKSRIKDINPPHDGQWSSCFETLPGSLSLSWLLGLDICLKHTFLNHIFFMSVFCRNITGPDSETVKSNKQTFIQPAKILSLFLSSRSARSCFYPLISKLHL